MRLMNLDLDGPANIGSQGYVTVRQLIETFIVISGKRLRVQYLSGPVGVQSGKFSNPRIYSLGWRRWSAMASASPVGRSYDRWRYWSERGGVVIDGSHLGVEELQGSRLLPQGCLLVAP
jgi:hypothetical protein